MTETNQICTTFECNELVWLHLVGGHPSGLCRSCYHKTKQDLRDGKEMVE